MPAVDDCEPQVIRALAKAGWVVIEKSLLLRLGINKRYVFADLRLRHRDRSAEALVVEVKCFPESRNELDEFYHAVGQYMVYRNAIRAAGESIPLYLSIPQRIDNYLAERPVLQATLTEAVVKLIVVDIDREEIVRWMT